MTNLGKFEEISYNEFYKVLEGQDETRQINSIELIESTENTLQGTYENGTQFKVTIPQNYDESLINLIRENVNDFTVKPPALLMSQIFFAFGPILFILLIIWYFSRRGSQMGNKIWSFGKSRAKINDNTNKTCSY